LNRRLDDVNRRKASLQGKLRVVRQRERNVTSQLQKAELHLEQGERELDRVQRACEITQSRLEAATTRLGEAETKQNRHESEMGDRLAAIYKYGAVDLTAVLLESASFAELANRLYLLNRVVGQDVDVMDELAADRAAVAAERRAIASRSQELSALRREAQGRQVELASRRDQTALLKRQIMQQRITWERALAELERNSREIESMLRRLATTAAGQARQATPWKGHFIRPVAGRVTSGYGYRTHPIFHVTKLHTGIDIGAPSGTPIHAAGDGEVVFSGRWGGYGNCIIIDHGGGVATLYGHCSALGVGVGQRVKQGQVIGRVGSTGLSTGPHLHWEVRHQGRPVNPG
jgi:murein DD-endopeptidase MepM/ murein hydrolase activator NlpD